MQCNIHQKFGNLTVDNYWFAVLVLCTESMGMLSGEPSPGVRGVREGFLQRTWCLNWCFEVKHTQAGGEVKHGPFRRKGRHKGLKVWATGVSEVWACEGLYWFARVALDWQQKCILSQFCRLEVWPKVSVGLVPTGGSEGEVISCFSPGFWWHLATLDVPSLRHVSRCCFVLTWCFPCVSVSQFPSTCKNTSYRIR